MLDIHLVRPGPEDFVGSDVENAEPGGHLDTPEPLACVREHQPDLGGAQVARAGVETEPWRSPGPLPCPGPPFSLSATKCRSQTAPVGSTIIRS